MSDDALTARLAALEARVLPKPPPSAEEIARQRRLEAAARSESVTGFETYPDGSIARVYGFDADGYRIDPADVVAGFTAEHVAALEVDLVHAYDRLRIAKDKQPGRVLALEARVSAVSTSLARARAGLEESKRRRTAGVAV